LVAGLGLSPAASAWSQAPNVQAFASCDGYGAPSRSGDGMTMQANTLGIFVPDPGRGTTVQGRVLLAASGVGACDRALASPLLAPNHWQRRVSLQRARAVHMIAAGQLGPGREALNAARAGVNATDPYFDRTMGLGFDVLQAWLQRDTDQAAASRMAIEVWRRRPYDNDTVAAALIAMGPAADPADVRMVLSAGAAVYPHLIPILYRNAYEQGRFAEAAALYNDIRINIAPDNRPPNPALLNLPPPMRRLAAREQAEEAIAARAGQQAYLLTALDRPQEAAAVLQAARDRLAILAQPLPRPGLRSDGRPIVDPMRQPTLESNARMVGRIEATLAAWSRLIGQRGQARTDPAALVAALRADPPPPTRAAVDLLDALMSSNLAPADRAFVSSLREKTFNTVVELAARGDAERMTLADLFNALPEPEVAGRLEAYSKPRLVGAKGQFWPVTPGAVVVTYYGYESSLAMVREQALLMAAEHARNNGFKGFIVLDRRDVQQGASSSPYGGAANMHIGYSSYLLTLPVDPAALPAPYATSGWRVLDAETVYRDLYPLYGPAARKKRS
jgi:hypothetical protein